MAGSPGTAAQPLPYSPGTAAQPTVQPGTAAQHLPYSPGTAAQHLPYSPGTAAQPHRTARAQPGTVPPDIQGTASRPHRAVRVQSGTSPPGSPGYSGTSPPGSPGYSGTSPPGSPGTVRHIPTGQPRVQRHDPGQPRYSGTSPPGSPGTAAHPHRAARVQWHGPPATHRAVPLVAAVRRCGGNAALNIGRCFLCRFFRVYRHKFRYARGSIYVLSLIFVCHTKFQHNPPSRSRDMEREGVHVQMHPISVLCKALI